MEEKRFKTEMRRTDRSWYFVKNGLTVTTPMRFTIDPIESETMEDLIAIAKKGIIEHNGKGNPTYLSAFENDYCNIPREGGIVVDEERGLAAFVLKHKDNLAEIFGIYGMRKNGGIIQGELLKYDTHAKRKLPYKYEITSLEEGVLTVKKSGKEHRILPGSPIQDFNRSTTFDLSKMWDLDKIKADLRQRYQRYFD